jgi:UDP-N-acetyl-D-mannosaminuronic acid transferase (WecB/TagA/CpsF family)
MPPCDFFGIIAAFKLLAESMKNMVPPAAENPLYRQILGVRFFVGDAPEAVEIGLRGGLVVVPAAPALLELRRDPEYRAALLQADLAITDSGFLVMLWNLLAWDRIHRVSGLEYLKLLLHHPEFRASGALWVMPTEASLERNLDWLNGQGLSIRREDCYVAPKYSGGRIIDDTLVNLVNERKSRHVIIGLGGGVQEKLGLYLKSHCAGQPAIHCIGAAIGFLSGDQVRIPDWADRWILGWLFRCCSNPGRFVPRYARALQLPVLLWRYRSRLPDLQVEC